MSDDDDGLKGTVMQIKENIDKWLLTRFKSILKVSHSNYFEFCSVYQRNLLFVLKLAYFLTVSIVFLVSKQNFTAPTRIAMNTKISAFVICVK